MATYTDPNTGTLYPSYEWYQEKVNPESGQLISSETLEGKPELPKEEPPIVGGDDFNEFKESVGETPNSTGWQGYIDKQNALMDSQQAAIDEEKKRLETQKTEAAETKSSFDTLMDKWLNRQTTEEKTDEEYAELGVDPAQYLAERKADIAELSGLWDEYNKMVTMKDTDIAQIESQAMAMPYMEGKKIAAEKKWNIKLNAMAAGINTKMAIMEMKTGTMDEARKFVNEAVENFVYDKKLDYEDLVMFKETYEDQLADMDKTYTNILNATIDKANMEYTMAKNDADQIGQLILQTSGQAGIDFDDTLQEAIQKAAKWQGTQAIVSSSQAVSDWANLIINGAAQLYNVPMDIRNEVAGLVNQMGIQKVSPGQLVSSSTGLPVGTQKPAVQEQAIALNGILEQGNMVMGKIQSGIDTGAVKGWTNFKGVNIPVLQNVLDPELLTLQTEMINLFQRYVYAMTGKQINEREVELAMRQTPSISGTKENNTAILTGFLNNTNQQLNNILTGNGWAFAQGETTQTQSTQSTQQGPLTPEQAQAKAEEIANSLSGGKINISDDFISKSIAGAMEGFSDRVLSMLK